MTTTMDGIRLRCGKDCHGSDDSSLDPVGSRDARCHAGERRCEPEPAAQDTVTVPAGQVTTLLTALDIATDYLRDRAAVCADCTSQSCPTCQSRLRHARACDRLAAHLTQAADASAAATASQPEPTPDREAGQ